jgi:hypothetical protein
MNRYRHMTAIVKKHAPVQVHTGAGKKAREAGKRPGIKGFFGLLPDWKIDTQSHKDELRD